MKLSPQISLLITTVLLTSACGISLSFRPDQLNDVVIPKVKSVDLYLGKASYSKNEFEQFKFYNNMLFSECGQVNGSRQTSQSQNIKRLSAEEIRKLNELAGKVIEFSKQHELVLDEPGSGSGFFDIGKFTLKISSPEGQVEIKTSFDSIVSASKTSEHNLKNLALEMRGLALSSGPGLCGNTKFHEL